MMRRRKGKSQGGARTRAADLTSADPEGERAEGAVRGGVAVAADSGAARKREALLGTDDVHDSLPAIVQTEVGDTKVAHVGLQRLNLRRALVLCTQLSFLGTRVPPRSGDSCGQASKLKYASVSGMP